MTLYSACDTFFMTPESEPNHKKCMVECQKRMDPAAPPRENEARSYWVLERHISCMFIFVLTCVGFGRTHTHAPVWTERDGQFLMGVCVCACSRAKHRIIHNGFILFFFFFFSSSLLRKRARQALPAVYTCTIIPSLIFNGTLPESLCTQSTTWNTASFNIDGPLINS